MRAPLDFVKKQIIVQLGTFCIIFMHNWDNVLSDIRSQIVKNMAFGEHLKFQWNTFLVLSKTAEEIDLCLKYGANPNSIHQTFCRNLLNVEKPFVGNRRDTLLKLFDAGLSPDCLNYEKKTLLHEAHCEDLTQVLLNKNTDPYQKNIYGMDALEAAFSEYRLECASVLLKNGCVLGANHSISPFGLFKYILRTWQLWSNNILETVIDYLLLLISPTWFQEEEIQTQISFAVGMCSLHTPQNTWFHRLVSIINKDSVQTFEKCFHDMSLLTGRNPLWFAVHCADHQTLNFLIQSKTVDVNEANDLGQTSLHVAMEQQSIQLIRILLQAGADPNSQDHFGQTPLHVLQNIAAGKCRHSEFTRFNLDIILMELLKYQVKTDIYSSKNIPSGQPLRVPMSQNNPDFSENNTFLTTLSYNELLNKSLQSTLLGVLPEYQTTKLRKI